jgi:hypothetical protein
MYHWNTFIFSRVAMPNKPPDVRAASKPDSNLNELLSMGLVIGAIFIPIIVALIIAMRIDAEKVAQRAPLELAAQDYVQLQIMAKRSPAGRKHLQEWVANAPILYRDYDKKYAILSRDVLEAGDILEKEKLLEVKRNIAELSYGTPY